MNLQEMMNQITTLGGQIQAANQKLASMCADPAVTMDEIVKQQGVASDMQKRMSALQDSYAALKGAAQATLTPVENKEPKSRKDMRASNEYATAFCCMTP